MPAKQDPLAPYRKKRSSGRSSEPAGRRRSARSKRPRFVVQKHDATSLHYDFRLEADGVLKSWAREDGTRLDPVGQDQRGDRRPEGARRVSLLDSLPEAQRQRGLREDKEPREVVCERPETLP